MQNRQNGVKRWVFEMLQSPEEVFGSRDFVDSRRVIRECYGMPACRALKVLDMFCI